MPPEPERAVKYIRCRDILNSFISEAVLIFRKTNRNASNRGVPTVVLGVLFLSLGASCSTTESAQCASNSDCTGGQVCLDAQCVESICSGERCVLLCATGTVSCGTGAEASCCGDGNVCYFGDCVTPGGLCGRNSECNVDAYCEDTLGRCLPLAGGEVCEVRPDFDNFELVEEWNWDGDDSVLSQHDQVMMAPMVANLTDDNDDGRIDEEDIPDVAFHTFAGNVSQRDGILRVISGADGSRIWPTSDPGYRTHPGGQIAIGDVDASSPGPEIAACGPGRTEGEISHLMIIAADGTLLRRFVAPNTEVLCTSAAPIIGDMDGDGTPEIVVAGMIVHADGSLVAQAPGGVGGFSVLADVDADPDLELITSRSVVNVDGSLVWGRFSGETALPAGGFVAVADLDLNGTPEIVTVSRPHFVRAVDGATGADVWGPFDINPPELAAVVAMSDRPDGGGPVTIANLDSDPFPEIAFAGGFAYVVFNHDGTRSWFYETNDRSSRTTGSSIFDFEGDGIAEVLYNDETRFRVFAGPDGSLRRDDCNTSGTLQEFPIVVDVDNDNEAEIVLMENDYAFSCTEGTQGTGIHVFGHPQGQWVSTRRIFNQHSYHVTNVEEDGTIPLRETPHWADTSLNSFRQNSQRSGIFNAPDARPIDLSADTSGCPDGIQISVRILNAGSAGMPAGVPVTFYADDGAGPVRLGRSVTSRRLLPGESEALLLSPAFAPPAGTSGELFRITATVNDPSDEPVAGFQQCAVDNDTIAFDVACSAMP